MPKAKRESTGRPTTSKDGGVRHVRYFRASDAEWLYIRRLADDYGMTASELIRDCLLGDMPDSQENDCDDA
jgi:hypothetical protein